MSKKGSPILTGGIILVLLMIVTGAVLMGSQYKQYQQLPVDPGFTLPGTLVHITDPASGKLVPAGEPQAVHIVAMGLAPIQGVELWVDQQMLGTIESPDPDGISPLPVIFKGLTYTPGGHTLRARALDAQGEWSDSEIVWLYADLQETVPGETSLPTQFFPSQIMPPHMAEGIEPLPAWAPSLPGFIQWMAGKKDSLVAPELVAQAQDCKVTLLIHDQSENEQGFSVYRTSEGETQNPTPTFALAAHPGQGWLIAEDTPPQSGLFSYVVTAFHGQDSSVASNPALVSVDCPEENNKPITYSLLLKQFKPPVAANNLYCYVSLDGINWQRAPEVGFFPAGVLHPLDLQQESEQEAPDTSLNGVDGGFFMVDSFFDITIDLHPPEPGIADDRLLTLWDCWGWMAGQLGSLGQFEIAVDPGQTGLIDLNKPEMGTELSFEVLPQNLLDSIFPPKPVLDPQLLSPTIHFSTETSDCVNRLPGWVKPDFANQMCHPGDAVDILNPGDLTLHPHAYLFWDLENKTNCGNPGSCIDPSDQASLDQWGYILADAGYNLYDLQVSSLIPAKTFHSLNDLLYIVPADESCGDVRTFKIRTWVKLFGSETVYESKGLGTVLSFVEPCGTLMLTVSTQEPIEMEIATQETIEIQLATPEIIELEVATPETP